MNYNDYNEIMKAEGLTLPLVGRYAIEQAIWCQSIIKALKKEPAIDTTLYIKQMEERKIGCILLAIEWARLEKQMPDAFKWADRQLEKQLERDRKGY